MNVIRRVLAMFVPATMSANAAPVAKEVKIVNKPGKVVVASCETGYG